MVPKSGVSKCEIIPTGQVLCSYSVSFLDSITAKTCVLGRPELEGGVPGSSARVHTRKKTYFLINNSLRPVICFYFLLFYTGIRLENFNYRFGYVEIKGQIAQSVY
jgi:hypothetical protein